MVTFWGREGNTPEQGHPEMSQALVMSHFLGLRSGYRSDHLIFSVSLQNYSYVCYTLFYVRDIIHHLKSFLEVRILQSNLDLNSKTGFQIWI